MTATLVVYVEMVPPYAGASFQTARGVKYTSPSGYATLIHPNDVAIAEGAGWVKGITSQQTSGANAYGRLWRFSGSMTYTAISAQSKQTQTFTHTGAIAGDDIFISVQAGLPAGIVIANAYVSAANTISVELANITGGSITPGAVSVSGLLIGV